MNRLRTWWRLKFRIDTPLPAWHQDQPPQRTPTLRTPPPTRYTAYTEGMSTITEQALLEWGDKPIKGIIASGSVHCEAR